MEVCRQFLSGRGINVPGEWISACIDFIKSEEISGTNQNMNMNWVKNKVYEQWLHSDLAEIGSSCLPADILNSNCKMLEGKFALQVNQIKDVGLPAYNQLQKLRKSNVENASVTAEKTHQAAWEPKATRMLWIEATDGRNSCHCMEYRVIPLLSLTMKPGCKIVVSGKIECRKGVLLLTREHVTILGGEVDVLLIAKAQENVLCRKLGLPLTQSPTEIDEQSMLSSTINSTQSQYYPTQSTQGLKTNSSTTANLEKSSTVSSLFAKQKGTSTNSNRSTRVDDFDDDFLDSATELAISQAESKAVRPPISSKNNLNNGKIKPGVKSIPSMFNSTQKKSVAPTMVQAKPQNCDDFNDELDEDINFDEDDMEMAMDMDEPEISYDQFGRPTFGSSKPVKKVEVEANSVVPNSFSVPSSSAVVKKSVVSSGFSIPSTPGVAKNSVVPSSFSVPSTPGIVKKSVVPIRSAMTIQEHFNTTAVTRKNKSVISKQSSTVVPNFSIDDFDVDFDLPMEDFNDENVFDKDKFLQNVESSPPFTYLCLINMKPSVVTRFCIKGFILTLLSRLTRDENGWTLTAKIGDGTKACCVDIHNKVLEKLIGLSTQEMEEQRERAKSDPSLKALRMQRLVDCQKQLIAVSCIFVLEVDPTRDRPQVVEFRELSPEHGEQLIRRKLN